MRIFSIGVIAIAAALALGGGSPNAQAKKPMTIVDVAEVARLLMPQLSPDGRMVVYVRQQVDWKTGRLVPQLWRQDVAGGPPYQLTFTEGGSVMPRWSPDGKQLLFFREGQLWLLGTEGGEARQLTRHTPSVSIGNAVGAAPAWTPDAGAVYFLAVDQPTADERERDRQSGGVVVYEENVRPTQLWKVIVATGAESQITKGDASVLEFRLSRDGKRIAFQRSSPITGEYWRGETWVMDAGGENARALTQNGIEELAPELSPDNSQVLFLADTNDKFEPYYPTNLFTVPASGGTPRALLPDFRYAIDQATWAPDGKSIYAIANMGVHSEVFQIDLASRRAKQLTNGEHDIVPGWTVVPSAGKMLLQFDEPTRFGEAWTLPLTGENPTPTRVTHVFDRLEREFALPRQEKVEWKSTDGTTIEGILFYPIDYQSGTRYPLVLQLHGGPMDSDRFGAGKELIMRYFPALAAKGYAVLRPNYRGSTGYGNAFYRDVVGHYFNNMQHDVLTGVDHLIKIGVADPNRLIVSGWSAGGHLTNKLITTTDRFKAASSGASIANWTSFYAQTDSRAFRVTWFGGTPWEKNAPLAAFWDHSPLKDVANVKTPTIFFAGENDRRVPMMATVEMWRALKSNGVPTVLYTAPGEGHQWGQNIRRLVTKANRELEWFERHAMGRSYTHEKTP